MLAKAALELAMEAVKLGRVFSLASSFEELSLIKEEAEELTRMCNSGADFNYCRTRYIEIAKKLDRFQGMP
ncbi:hypothetical protein HY546_00625 [archaeon]|nr:hypothetical protein [archaeon]